MEEGKFPDVYPPFPHDMLKNAVRGVIERYIAEEGDEFVFPSDQIRAGVANVENALQVAVQFYRENGWEVTPVPEGFHFVRKQPQEGGEEE